jgi:hypothetical protein
VKLEQFREIKHLDGIEFIEALLKSEKEQFQSTQFQRGSTFEDINTDFGIFPTQLAYPVYFAGDIRSPDNKIVLMGINPGFNESKYTRERQFLEERGLFDGYCNLYGKYFKVEQKKNTYYANVWGFFRRLFGFSEEFEWDWFQEHVITLEFIPYHSVNVQGLTINNRKKFSETYFAIILKFLRAIDPQQPVFINGFPSIRNFVTKKKVVYPEFSNLIEFTEHDTIAVGKLGKQFDFIGLPFLNRPKGGKDALVDEIRRVMPGIDWQLRC